MDGALEARVVAHVGAEAPGRRRDVALDLAVVAAAEHLAAPALGGVALLHDAVAEVAGRAGEGVVPAEGHAVGRVLVGEHIAVLDRRGLDDGLGDGLARRGREVLCGRAGAGLIELDALHGTIIEDAVVLSALAATALRRDQPESD